MTTANTSLVATTVTGSFVATTVSASLVSASAVAAAAVASLASLIAVIMVNSVVAVILVASAVTTTITSPTRSTAIAVVRGTARSHGVEMGWDYGLGWMRKSVKYHAGREKKTVVLFSGAAVGRGGKMLTFLFVIWQKADRLSSLEPPGGEKKSSEGKARGRGRRNSIDIHGFGRHDAHPLDLF